MAKLEERAMRPYQLALITWAFGRLQYYNSGYLNRAAVHAREVAGGCPLPRPRHALLHPSRSGKLAASDRRGGCGAGPAHPAPGRTAQLALPSR
jgi:hypothetical protein